MLGAHLDLAHADLVAERTASRDVDDGRRHRADDRARRSRTGHDTGGRGVRDGRVVPSECPHFHDAAVALEVEIADQPEREFRHRRKAELGLQRRAHLLPVVRIVPRREVPDVGVVVVQRVAVIEGRGRAADGVFAVKQIQRDAEVAAAAEHVEHLLVRERREWVRAVFFADRRLLEKRRRIPRDEIVGRAALFPQVERRARLEVERAAK